MKRYTRIGFSGIVLGRSIEGAGRGESQLLILLFGKRTRRENFEEAALPHLNELYRSARRIVSDDSGAQDVVQETYLRAWRSFGRFQPGTNCRAWLFKILINCSRDYWKRQLNHRAATESEIILRQQEAPPPVPDGLTDPEIVTAMRNMPPKLREVIVLADVEEFSYREIADLLHVPIGTVMSRLSRARALLRKLLSSGRTQAETATGARGRA